ncbi:MAG: hypothetical protein K1X31_09325 [Gemmatimonadaceae bacterium]|nr:hypothetical protein [Gemmatimonadaceae bacterium]
MLTLLARIASRAMPALLAAGASTLGAQTDFYNTDRARPLVTEDAVVIERRAFELQLAPLTLTRAAAGAYGWGLAPELAWGLAPRTQLGIALPLAFTDAAGARPRAAIAGAEVELLHQLNAESTTLPAFALGVDALLPVGPLGPARTLTTVRTVLTRTHGWGRLHLNGAWTPGDALAPGDAAVDHAARWSAGLALDHTFALRSTLVGVEATVAEPLVDGADAVWRAGAGLRRQATPRLAVDAGLHRVLGGGSAEWSLTMGAAFAFAPARMPGFPRGAR